MKKIYLLILLIGVGFMACSGSKYSVRTDDEGKKIITGQITWEQWQNHAGWSNYSAVGYNPNSYLLKEIADRLTTKDLSFLIFAGSWCSDSEAELPKLYKVLTMAGVFPDKIELYGVDRQKQEPSGTATEFKIEKVPTLIVFAGDEEIGRIVESPKKSWDVDISEIIRNYIFK